MAFPFPSNWLRNPTAQQIKLEMARQKRISYFNEIFLKLFLIRLAWSPTNTYINDFFACLTTRLGNPNPLRERQRETEIGLLGQQRERERLEQFSNVNLTESFTGSQPVSWTLCRPSSWGEIDSFFLSNQL